MHHPFTANNFKIRTEEQLATIRQLGLKAVRWDPLRSDVNPLAKGQVAVAAADSQPQGPATEFAADPVTEALMAAKHRRIRQLLELRENMARTEQAFANAANVVRGINKSIHAEPEKTLQQARQLIAEMAAELLAAPELAIQVMAGNRAGEDLYFHSLNVTVLAMILGRELRMPAELVRMIGIGALFHDIGLNEIPARILGGSGALTKAERDFREQHCRYGFETGKKAGLPPAALNIILQHHEQFDGSGYPAKLKGEAIDLLARLVAVVNIYDNLCNPANVAQALTPHEALSQVFAQQRNHFDPRLLQAFIRFMGVYPPGTIVGLSNEVLGLVVKTNSARPLKPIVIVYDAEIPKQEAVILDLDEEPGINISRAIRPAQLPQAVFDYLSPRRRVSYYFDAEGAGR
jgi:putative nucleotidyltransferase with HDIG domain